jgi:hypothetical protein
MVAGHFYHFYHFYHFFCEKYPLEETYNCNLWRLSSKKVVELVGMRLMVATGTGHLTRVWWLQSAARRSTLEPRSDTQKLLRAKHRTRRLPLNRGITWQKRTTIYVVEKLVAIRTSARHKWFNSWAPPLSHHHQNAP